MSINNVIHTLILALCVCSLLNYSNARSYENRNTVVKDEYGTENTLSEGEFDKGNYEVLSNRLLQSTEPEESTDHFTEEGTGEGEAKTKKGFWQKTIEGCGYSFLFIFLSEIGDKTFLFIVLYATRMNGMKLLLISSIGLCGMHVAGVAVGGVFKFIFNEFWLHWITVISFFVIGCVLLYMGITEEAQEEDFDHKMKEIEVEMIEKRSSVFSDDVEEEDPEENNLVNGSEPSGQKIAKKKHEDSVFRNLLRMICLNEPVKIILTIVCTEMGDRSQISAIALAANYNFWIVAVAGSFGHILALILAILFGKAVSAYTTEKCINIVGGTLFLIFAAYSLAFD